MGVAVFGGGGTGGGITAMPVVVVAVDLLMA
jgi:hypothetical protein